MVIAIVIFSVIAVLHSILLMTAHYRIDRHVEALKIMSKHLENEYIHPDAKKIGQLEQYDNFLDRKIERIDRECVSYDHYNRKFDLLEIWIKQIFSDLGFTIWEGKKYASPLGPDWHLVKDHKPQKSKR